MPSLTREQAVAEIAGKTRLSAQDVNDLLDCPPAGLELLVQGYVDAGTVDRNDWATFLEVLGRCAQVAQLLVPIVGAVTGIVGVVTAVKGRARRSSIRPMADLSVCSTALEASHVLKADKGRLKRLVVQLDSTAPTAGYYVHVVQGTQGAIPADGALPKGASFLRAPHHVNHTIGATDTIVLAEDIGEDGLAFEGGLAVWLSTTLGTKTISGAYLLIDADLRD